MVFLNDQPIKRVNVTKSLGVLIDERLAWFDHIDSTCKKVSGAMAGFRKVRPIVSHEIAITIYNSLLKPLLDYCYIIV